MARSLLSMERQLLYITGKCCWHGQEGIFPVPVKVKSQQVFCSLSKKTVIPVDVWKLYIKQLDFSCENCGMKVEK